MSRLMSAWIVFPMSKVSCVAVAVPSGLAGQRCDSEEKVLPPFRDDSRTSSNNNQHSASYPPPSCGFAPSVLSLCPLSFVVDAHGLTMTARVSSQVDPL